MILSTTADVTGYKTVAQLGLVSGNIVQSKHVGRDIMAGIKTLIGGEIAGYTEMLAEARDKAVERMLDDAQSKGANAVVNLRFTTSAIAQSMSEILAYGTAVKLEKDE
ncbi:MAG TPA: YbjQ family protein [Marinagarivorans sp.]